MVDLGFAGPSRRANDHEFVKVVDGYPRVTMDIRMVSIDTPETKFENLTPVTAQAALERAKARLQDGTYDALPEPLREYLTTRITSDAAQRHIDAGLKATDVHRQQVDERLALPAGKKRKMAVIATGALLDDNGRLLAYTAPWFGGGASDPLPRRTIPGGARSTWTWWPPAGRRCLSSTRPSRGRSTLICCWPRRTRRGPTSGERGTSSATISCWLTSTGPASSSE